MEKKIFMVTVPSEIPNGKPTIMVCDDLSVVIGKFDFFIVQSVPWVELDK